MRRLGLLIVLASVCSTTAHAQYYTPPPDPPPWIHPKFIRGSLTIQGFASIVVGQTGSLSYLQYGGGIGLDLGLDIGRFIGLRLGYDASFHDPQNNCTAGASYLWCNQSYIVLETVHLDFILHIPTGTRFQPFVMAGVLAGIIGRQGSPTDAVGGGFEAGGGFDIWLSRWATLGIEAKYRGIQMNDFANTANTAGFLSLVNVGGNLGVHF
jgi:opacity protein-like surface antigen